MILNVLKFGHDNNLVSKNSIVTYQTLLKWRVTAVIQMKRHNNKIEFTASPSKILLLHILYLRAQGLISDGKVLEYCFRGDGWNYKGKSNCSMAFNCTTSFPDLKHNDTNQSAFDMLQIYLGEISEEALYNSPAMAYLRNEIASLSSQERISILGETYNLKYTFCSDLKYLRSVVLLRENGDNLQCAGTKLLDQCPYCTLRRACADTCKGCESCTGKEHWRHNENLYELKHKPIRQLKNIYGLSCDKCITDLLHLGIRITGNIN